MEEYWWRNYTVISGYDIGFRQHPSHHSVFAITDDPERIDAEGRPIEVLVQLHQKFLDGKAYTDQIEYLKAAVEYFNISRCYYDNTRGEFTDRALPRQCIPIILSNKTGPNAKGKMEMAANFAKLVEQHRIKLIDDDRFISQITCVSNQLESPDTPSGHGDSFITVMLAVSVYYDFYARDRILGVKTLGNMQEIFNQQPNKIDLKSPKLSENICKVCGGRVGENRICQKCGTSWQ
jgi:hypothetical protein